MATMKEAVRAVLTGDATLMALATGGVHDHDTVGRRGLTRETLMTAGVVAIKPAIYINWTTEAPFGVRQATLQAERLFFEVYFYQDSGYATIVSMRKRVKALLNYQPTQYNSPANEWMHDIRWAGDLLEMKDEELGGVSMERTRYEVLVTPTGGS